MAGGPANPDRPELSLLILAASASPAGHSRIGRTSLEPDQPIMCPARRGFHSSGRLLCSEFELQIGAALPRQTELHDLPPELAEAMNGYWHDQYVLVRDTMVIVDRNSRRVVAIVPGVA